MKKALIFLLLGLVYFTGCKKTETPVDPPTHGSISGLITEFGTDAALKSVNVYTSPFTSHVTTDSLGAYKINNVEPGVYNVTAFKRDYDSLSVGVTVIAGQTTVADFILQKSDSLSNTRFGKINGTVQDAASGTPLANVNLYTIPPSIIITTTSSGAFTFENMEAGTYQLIAKKSGYDSARVSVSVIAGLTSSANILMNKADTTVPPATGNLTGKVIDGVTGLAVSNAEVSTDPSTTVVFTDETGNYNFNNLQPGSYTVSISKNYYSSTSSSVTITAGITTTADFSLTPSVGKIQGSVIDSTGAAIPDVVITTSPETGSFITDNNGGFTIENVPVGSVTVSAEKIGFVTKSVSVSVNPGETATVVIMLATN
jgi:uncharacterized protein (DUF2141 family)